MSSPVGRLGNTDIAGFYNEFLGSRMLAYRINGNARIDRISDTVRRVVRPGDHVVEFGCGIGMLTEVIARYCSPGRVDAFDISPSVLEYARKTVYARNILFHQADIVNDWNKVDGILGNSSAIDVVVMADFIEHVPLTEHPELFARITPHLHDGSRFVLSFPSVYYQRYLSEHRRSELQPVDEVVTAEQVLQWARQTSTILVLYQHVDVWSSNQYVHVVLRRQADPLAPQAEPVRNLLHRVAALAGRLLLAPLLTVRRAWRVFRYRYWPFRQL